MSQEQAASFVDEKHRHHRAPTGHRFSLGAFDSKRGVLCGVAMVGRPVARRIDSDRVVEVNRCATDGTRNACSFLYSAAGEVARLLGFSAIITYTLDSESGASLRALGWWGERLPDSDNDAAWCTRDGREERALGLKWRWLKLLGDFDARTPQPVTEPLTRDLFGAAS